MSPKKTNPSKLSCKWYLADDVRSEVDGKCTLVGLYTDDKVVVQMPPEAPDPTSDRPLGIEGLAILCSVRGLVGSADFELTISSKHPDDIAIKQEFVANSPDAAHNLNLISRLRPVIVGSLGERSMTLESKKLGFRDEFKFRIVRGLLHEPGTVPKAQLKKKIGRLKTEKLPASRKKISKT